MYSTKEVLEQMGLNKFDVYVSYEGGMLTSLYENVNAGKLETDDYTGSIRYTLFIGNESCLKLSSKFEFTKKDEDTFICDRGELYIKIKRLKITY